MAMCFLKSDALNNITINSMVPDNTLPILSIKVGDTAEIIERLPYYVTDVVTKKRNRISTRTVTAICKVRSYFEAHGVTTKSFRTDSTQYLMVHRCKYNFFNVLDVITATFPKKT
ncbi:hypothetical protein PV328_008418 [Microctonus aethiopoides]|uniref:Uncharacterized protein n=1 Tax=Microctonus aethiopoides TaxID=144406 RepID=A0AA39FJJ0_9HYME|nr:hypothetical protein PV328_008418 [Microctonus aethiopoides]